jgi:hypothetical protein
MEGESQSGQRLRVDIDKLKNPVPYQEKFETEGIRELKQAVDILGRLASEAYRGDASRVGYEKLRNAQMYLDRLLKQQLEPPKEELK